MSIPNYMIKKTCILIPPIEYNYFDIYFFVS